MLPGNVDPRRPDKVQRYVPKSNGNGQEDLTTDYMNILGQHATTSTANVPEPNTDKHHADSSVVGGGGGVSGTEAGLQVHPTLEEDELAASVVVVPPPTSPPQYGVAILPNNHPATTTMAESDETPSPGLDINQVVKTGGEDGVNVISSSNASNNTSNSKDLQSTPSRNDRFKVVKIASLEPFKRGRWKCMDYVDEAPPNSNVQGNKVAQSSGSIQVATATAGGGGPTGVYLQTQSLPQQQIQQMLLQSGFSNGTPVFPTTAQMLPQGQYYYPAPQQVLQQAQFIGSQPQPAYFPAGVTIQNAAGFAQFVPQYVPNLHVPTQNSAFVATSQPVQMPGNFQQSQTYGGQTNVGQGQQQQPLVNGHSYGQNEQQQQVGGGGGGSIPTQAVKSVILNSAGPQPVVSQNQITQQLAAVTQQQQQQPNHMPPQSAVQQQQQQQQQQQNNQSQSVTAIPNHHQQSQQQYVQANIVGFQSHPQPQQQQVTMTNAAPLSSNQTTTTTNQVQTVPVVQTPAIIQVSQVVPAQNFDQSLANNVYTNPQFTMSVNSLTVLDNSHEAPQGGDVMLQEAGGAETGGNDSAEDLTANTNPVVNAIDNKIEQAMDLVKSHLMYTVREEVEVLKEKITELMDRIQQLETENNFLRNQIPKNQQQQQVASSSSSSTVCTSNAVTTTNTVPMVVNAATVGTVAASAGPPPTVATNNPVGLGNNYNSSQSAANAVTPNDVISNQ